MSQLLVCLKKKNFNDLEVSILTTMCISKRVYDRNGSFRFETLTVGQCYRFPIADVRVTASQADGTQRCTRYACVLQADLATVKRAGLLTHRVEILVPACGYNPSLKQTQLPGNSATSQLQLIMQHSL